MHVSHAETAYTRGVYWPPSVASTENTDEVRGVGESLHRGRQRKRVKDREREKGVE